MAGGAGIIFGHHNDALGLTCIGTAVVLGRVGVDRKSRGWGRETR